MKKVIRTAIVLATGAVLALSSCKKADEATPVESLSSGTITGTIFYDADEVNDYDKDGLEISANVDSDVPTGATVRYSYTDENAEEVVGTTTVDASGKYSFDVPTSDEGVNVTISVDDFAGTYTFEYFDDEGEEEEATESGYFSEVVDFATEEVLPGKTSYVAKQLLGSFNSTDNPSNYDAPDEDNEKKAVSAQ